MYDKSEIRKGMFLEKDCPIRAPIRYGDPPDPDAPPPPPDFSTITARIEAARRDLETAIEGYRRKRQRP